MELSVRSMGWLRTIDGLSRDGTATDTVGWSLAVALLARRTPAWIEPSVRILDRLIAVHTAAWPAGAAAAELAQRPDTAELLTVLHTRALLGADDRLDQPFELAGDGRTAVTHSELLEAAGAAGIGRAPLPHDAPAGPAAGAAGDPQALALELLRARDAGDADRVGSLLAILAGTHEPVLDAATGAFRWSPLPGAAPLPERATALLAAADATGPGMLAEMERPLGAQPQLVDVDFPTFGLRRAEWDGGGFLTMRFDPLVEDRKARTRFRLVGAEPRVWWVSGLENVLVHLATEDSTITAPLAAATVEFAPSSF
ncbi:MAG: hypothetical protein AB7O92_09735 [Acidimicrobiia bacterium]